jgi:hypothetical protein
MSKIKLKKRYLSLILLPVIVISLLYVLSWTGEELYWRLRLNRALCKQSDIITNLNKGHYKETARLRQEKEKDKQFFDSELLRHKKVEAIIKYYKKYGTIQQYYWITPEYLYSVIVWAEKYQGYSRTFNFDTFDRVNFALAWAVNETNLDPKAVYTRNENGKHDYGLMQINQDNLWMFHGADKFNPEESIKVWFTWLDHKGANQQGVWQIWDGYIDKKGKRCGGFRKDGGKEMYFILREVK